MTTSDREYLRVQLHAQLQRQVQLRGPTPSTMIYITTKTSKIFKILKKLKIFKKTLKISKTQNFQKTQN